jgi:hypothetical protein
LALLVRNGSRPKVGDLFEVDYHGTQLVCTVVRRQAIERSVSVLGCRAEALGTSCGELHPPTMLSSNDACREQGSHFVGVAA